VVQVMRETTPKGQADQNRSEKMNEISMTRLTVISLGPSILQEPSFLVRQTARTEAARLSGSASQAVMP